MKILSFILDFIFPPACPVCECSVFSHGQICGACWSKFNWIGDPKCCICGYPFPSNLDLGARPLCPHCSAGFNELDFLRAACVYDDFSRDVMLQFKHAGQLKFSKIMSRAMINSLCELWHKSECVGAGSGAKVHDQITNPGNKEPALCPMPYAPDLVLPVPLANRRLWKRGYNQATILARPIAAHFNVPIDVNSVKRKYRPDMGHKNAKQRAENIHGVFKVVNSVAIRDKTILLVDDVMTTGATFAEMYRILKKAGAKAVYGVTFCRVVRAI